MLSACVASARADTWKTPDPTRNVKMNEQADRIFGKRPWKSRTEELQQVAEERRRQAEAARQQQAAAQQQDAPAAPQDSAPGDDTPLDTPSHSSGDTPPRFNK